jgi:acyl-CoA synthetase (AMP-forming)/AMP-acid ligase II
VDAHGEVSVKDRRHDLIIRGGSNVYPAEVERVLHADPRVAACAVVGKPDERLGERVVAFVEPAPGVTVTPDELAAATRRELATYKVPDEWHLVDAMPRNAMNKILKNELRARLSS